METTSKISVELRKEPRKYNTTLRISGVDKITPDTLKVISGLCSLMSENEVDPDLKMKWGHFASNAREVADNNLCPEKGVSILGPFLLDTVVMPDKGDTVTINKGAMIQSTHPDFDEGAIASKRAQTITVHRVSGGYIDKDRETCVEDPQVHWAGTGGYWRWTSLSEIKENGL